ncbi:MAG: hypothetical protein A3J46_06900 [Candidatus Yanofskybacteria bacterium RIFCSPHIGHO2_02_FULL_41_11]|uniref:Uncharacterized protein n=1 Tax=Candidatus Yanofskybacteria bacterium RIFCSPHIGHO2_02_FULL_41_11 TaxID=1802675 RepID=A0A1F8FA87_9BACT|nr:MAG: hypothetical protein A3J46_06900 [Candidatus Yanofskybacteria bacterium RIFCSPHIGHO2_02_FULL_41_11]
MSRILWVWLVVAVAAFVGGYFSGHSVGYKTAETDLKKVQEESAKKSAEDAAKAANPFQAVNPLAGVESNPFEKAKQVLNPFK